MSNTQLDFSKLPEPKKPPSLIKHLLKLFCSIVYSLFILSCIIGSMFIYNRIEKEKDDSIQSIKNSDASEFKMSVNSHIYNNDGEEMFLVREGKNVEYLEYDEIPENVINAFIAIEDKRFYEHHGVDYQALIRVLVAYIKNKGVITQGGSTLTQQLIKLTYLTNEQVMSRKIPEIFMAMEFEEKFSKEDVLEYYINNIYFANNAYGINSASLLYFNKPVKELSVSQVAYLVSIPNIPNKFNPYNCDEGSQNKDTIERRDLILKCMYEQGYITEEDFLNAKEEEISVHNADTSRSIDVRKDFIVKETVEVLMSKNGFKFEYSFKDKKEKEIYEERYNDIYQKNLREMYSNGYNIYTSFDEDMQSKVQSDIDNCLKGDTEISDSGVFSLQASSTVVDNETGLIKAMIGGRTSNVTDYLDRASNVYRQNGSTMKPIAVYAPALDIMGYVPITKIDNSDYLNLKNSSSFTGGMTLREALQWSSNTVASRVFVDITPEVGLSYLTNMQFKNIVPDDYVPAVALGGMTNGTNTKEMAGAFSALANKGRYNKPSCIIKIEDTKGNIIYKHDVINEQIYKVETAIMMTSMLKTVAYEGTGNGCSFNNTIEVAGKTGTTDSTKDGWYVGYSPKYTTAVWTGYDMPRELYYTDSTKPVNIWKTIMSSVHEGLSNLKFEEPEDLIKWEFVNSDGFKVKEGTDKGRWEIFPKNYKVDDAPVIIKEDSYESLKLMIEDNTNKAYEEDIDLLTLSVLISNLKETQARINNSSLNNEEKSTLKSLADYNMSIIVNIKSSIEDRNNNNFLNNTDNNSEDVKDDEEPENKGNLEYIKDNKKDNKE